MTSDQRVINQKSKRTDTCFLLRVINDAFSRQPVQQKDDKMTNNDLRNIRQKTTDRTTRAPLEPEGELMCSERVSRSYST